MSSSTLRQLLRRFGSDKYHIEYNDFFSSHVLHALVALHHLGASNARLDEHASLHATWLEAAKPIELDRPIDDDNWKSLRGRRRNYREFSAFFLSKIRLSSAGEVVGRYVPEMASGGLCVAAFHPLIHIGYGLLAEQDEDVADGLAYMAFAFRSPQPDHSLIEGAGKAVSFATAGAQGPFGHPVLSLIRTLRSDERLNMLLELFAERLDPATFEKGSGLGMFDRRMFMVDDHARSILLKYVDDSGLLPSPDASPVELRCAFRSLFEGAVLVFALSRPKDDFFLLHGVTSAFALYMVLQHLLPTVHKLNVIRYFCAGLLATFVVRDMPAVVDVAEWPESGRVPEWDTLIKSAIANDDEHTIKLVFSCCEADKLFGSDVRGVPLYRTVSAWRLGLLAWP